MKGIFNDRQKLLKYFNGTAIFTPSTVPSDFKLPIGFHLYLNNEVLTVVTSTLQFISFLLNTHKLPDISE